MNQRIIEKLTDKDDRYAYALTEKIASESEKTDTWFSYFDDSVSYSVTQNHLSGTALFASLLRIFSGMTKTGLQIILINFSSI